MAFRERASFVLFDFFGTLVDYSPSRTEQGYERSFELMRRAGARFDYPAFLDLWSKVSEEFDVDSEQTKREFSMMEVSREFLGRAVASTNEALAREFSQTYLAEWSQGIRCIDGVPDLLRRLHKGFRLSVITNTHDRELVPRHLEAMGVANLFEEVVTSVEFGLRKPAVEIFRHATGRLETRPEDCVYIGDNYAADYLGATAAGLRAFLIDPSGVAPIAGHDRLSSIHEIEGKLATETEVAP